MIRYIICSECGEGHESGCLADLRRSLELADRAVDFQQFQVDTLRTDLATAGKRICELTGRVAELEAALREWLEAYEVGAETSYETTEREVAAMAQARAALSGAAQPRGES